MASAPKVMNRITAVMKLVTRSGGIEIDSWAASRADSGQLAANPRVARFGLLSDPRGPAGMEFAIEQTALKTKITILERREQ